MEMKICYEDFELKTQNVIHVGKKKQHISLSIRNSDYPYTEASEFLFSQFGTMHMVSALLPEKITLMNYKLKGEVERWIKKMYKVSGRENPRIISLGGGVPGISYKNEIISEWDENKVIIPFSGGKDSVFHFLQTKQKGMDTHLIHVQNLNLTQCSEEKKYAHAYASWKKIHLDLVHLKNGTPRNGFETMRDRDMFLVTILIPYALRYKVGKIMIEGFGDEAGYDLFSGKERYMREFNQLLYMLGFMIEIVWEDVEEWRVLELMIRQYPEDLAHTNSCFSYPLLKKRMQKEVCWPKYPGFPFFESQCGMCFKCFIVNLARIAFDENLNCPKKTMKAYVSRAERWLFEKIKKKGSHYEDPTFLQLLTLCRDKTA